MRIFYFWVKKNFVKNLFYFSLRTIVRIFVQSNAEFVKRLLKILRDFKFREKSLSLHPS